MKQTLIGLGGVLFVVAVLTLGGLDDIRHAALAQPAPAPSPSPSASPAVHYLAAFAPIRTCPGERLTFVNPALVVKMDDREDSGVTRLTLTDGETIRACGSLLEVAHTLRVSVWLEEGR